MRLRGLATMSAIALVTAGFVVACGAFGTDPAVTSAPGDDAANDVTVAEGSAPDSALADADSGCVLLVQEEFSMPVLAGFNDTAGNTGSVKVDPAQFTSPPSSLYAGGSVTAATSTRATTQRDLPLVDGGLAAGSLELDFDVFLEQSPTTYAELGCTIELRDNAAAWTRVTFARTTGGVLLLSAAGGDAGAKTAQIGALGAAGWHHVHGHVASIDPANVGVQYAVAPGSVPTSPSGVSVPTSAAVDRVRVLCGIGFAAGTTDASALVSVHVDGLRVQQCSK